MFVRADKLVIAVVAVLVLSSAPCGCARFDLPQRFSWFKDDSGPQTPDQMTDVWTYTVLRQHGKPSVRGFGGRIMFYAQDDKKPVKVDGTLTVFAFDAANDDPAKAIPEKKFIFPAAKLQDKYSKSKLGHSYSFWLPWGEVGGPPRKISLFAHFESADGELVMGQQSVQMLPAFGVADAARAKSPDADGRPATLPGGKVRQVANEEPLTQPGNKGRLDSTTIDLTPSFVNQIGKLPEEPEPAVEETEGDLPPDDQAEFRRATEPVKGTPEKPAEDTATVRGRLNPVAAPVRDRRSSTRSAPVRFPARRVPGSRPWYDPVRKKPYLATWPSRLPATPRSNWWREWMATSSNAGTTRR